MTASDALATADLPDPVDFLESAEPEIEGRMPWSSNGTFLVTMRGPGPGGVVEQRAVYKPVTGERPLWDFEPGLDRRERAMFLLSEHLGVHAVPPTVVRDGPLGPGSFQWFVDADHREHYFTIYERFEHVHDQLRRIALLDIVANNTDRKSGHCLLAHDRVWAIDNGLCFSAQFKLRTVIWEFAGDPIPDDLVAPLAHLASEVPADIAALLDDDETAAVRSRAAVLSAEMVMPHDETGSRYPWPLV